MMIIKKNKLGAFARNVYPITPWMVFVTNREWLLKLSRYHQIIAEIATTMMVIYFAVPITGPNYLPRFTLIYQNISTGSTFYCDLPLFTWVYPYFPLLSMIYRDLPLFTEIYHLTYKDKFHLTKFTLIFPDLPSFYMDLLGFPLI